MSGWAYKKCNECGGRIHINSICKCGGDPWGVIDSAKKKLIRLQQMKDAHLKILKEIESEINRTKEIIQL